MNRLTELGFIHGTDKAAYHRFTDVYEPYFKELTNPSIMEIGVFKGASVKMMNDYYNGNCKITTLDNGLYSDYKNDLPNVCVVDGDQSKREDLLDCVKNKRFDMIIDDGGHIIEHQILSFSVLFPYVKFDGIYIIEDLHTSHPKDASWFNPKGLPTTIEFLEKLKENIVIPYSFLLSDEMEYLKTHIKSIEIFYMGGPGIYTHEGSVTSVIRKV